MKLYSFFNSSTSYRVRIALALKGVSYEYQGVNIRIGEQETADYIHLNPAKGVPLLIDDDGFRLNQSLAIIEYLDACFPEPALLPKDIKLRAQVRAFAYGISCDIHPINNLRVLKYLKNQLGVTDQQKADWYKHWVAEGLSAAESILSAREKTPYCFGEQPSLADICLIPQIANAKRFGCDLSAYPRLMEVFEHSIKHPAFMQAQPEEQPDFIK